MYNYFKIIIHVLQSSTNKAWCSRHHHTMNASPGLTAPLAPQTPQRVLTEDVDVDTPAPAARAASKQLDVEDALDQVGGLGKYQIGHFLACGVFWFAQSGILVSVFVNTAWDDRYREVDTSRWWSECREYVRGTRHNSSELICDVQLDCHCVFLFT